MNQSGERVPYGFEVNTLTVMANESYEQFVSELQKEIEQEEGIKFGAIESISLLISLFRKCLIKSSLVLKNLKRSTNI